MAWRVVGAAIFGLGLVAGALAAPARRAATGPGPAAAPAAEAPAPLLVAPAPDTGDLRILEAVLRGMAGADPVVCELALIALEGRGYGWHGLRADIEATAPAGIPADELAAWASEPPRDDARLIPPLADALGGADPCAARAAARLLGRIGSDPAVAALRSAARAPEAPARRNAAIGLGLAERRETGPDLQVLLADDDASVRASAAWALGELEDPAAVPMLVRALRQDRDATARRAAAWALGRIE